MESLPLHSSSSFIFASNIFILFRFLARAGLVSSIRTSNNRQVKTTSFGWVAISVKLNKAVVKRSWGNTIFCWTYPVISLGQQQSGLAVHQVVRLDSLKKQYLCGCPSEQNSCARYFKVHYHKLYINRKVKNCKIWKKYPLFGRAILEKKEAGKQKTTECSSAQFIGYQTQPLLKKYCTLLISKYQSLKVCKVRQAFS